MSVFHVYCDESHTDGPGDGYRVQGGIWVPDHGMRAVRDAFRELRRRHPKITEMKWTYVTTKKPLTIYVELVNLFFASPVADLLSFKCFVVQRAEDASRTLDKYGRDVGFYKSYYTFLNHRLVPGATHHVRLDKRSSPRQSPEAELASCLNSTGWNWSDGTPRVESCAGICSKDDDLIQLADVLSGAVGWAWNGAGAQTTCGAKPILHRQITDALGWTTLARETSGSARKFNIWRYRPRRT